MKNIKSTTKRQDYYRVLLYFLLVFDLCCLGYSAYRVEIGEKGTDLSQKDYTSEAKCNWWNRKDGNNIPASGEVASEKSKQDESEQIEVIPCGIPVGIYVETEGLLVLGTQILNSADGLNYEPAKNIVREGDYIISANGNTLHSKEELQGIVMKSGGEKMELGIRRDNKETKVHVTPVMTSDGGYKLGIWLRDDTQGLGTITYIKTDEQGSEFGALGHSINDYDTGTQMEIGGGSLYEARILSVKKGESGQPGELVGQVQYGISQYIGKISSNGEEGIYGTLECDADKLTSQDPVPVAKKEEIKRGKAYIRFTLDGETKDYEVRIKKVDRSTKNTKQGILFEVTDEELLEKTGGIVQGMSGSPILQDGKIIGAVTHVLVDDPTRGYGIFIEEMIER